MDGMDKFMRRTVRAKLADQDLTLRVLSHLEVSFREEYQMLAMIRRRREIENPESLAHELFVQKIETAPIAELVDLLVNVREYELTQDVLKQVKPQVYPFPDDATPEEKADVVSKREAEGKRVSEEILSIVTPASKKYRDELEAMENSKVIALSKLAQVEQQSRLSEVRAYQDYTVFAATYLDDGCVKRMFAGPDEVSNLTPEIRTALVSFYFNKVDVLTGIDLTYFLSMGDSTGTSPQSSSQDGVKKAKSHGTSPKHK